MNNKQIIQLRLDNLLNYNKNMYVSTIILNRIIFLDKLFNFIKSIDNSKRIDVNTINTTIKFIIDNYKIDKYYLKNIIIVKQLLILGSIDLVYKKFIDCLNLVYYNFV